MSKCTGIDWLTLIPAGAAATAALVSAIVARNGLQHQKDAERAEFWRQSTDLFNTSNSFNAERGIPGPRIGKPGEVEASILRHIADISKTKSPSEIGENLRTSFWNQLNIAHIIFQHKPLIDEDTFQRAESWFVNGVCVWAKIVENITKGGGYTENPKEGVFSVTFDTLLKEGDLFSSSFRDDWIAKGLGNTRT